MTPRIETPVTTEGDHRVHLYRSDEELVTWVVDAFAATADRRDTLVLVATADHRAAIEAGMRARGITPGPERYAAYDAARMLDKLLVGGTPDRLRFRGLVGRMVRDLVSVSHLTIYGEMVNLLWERGDVVGAVRLERLWNDLAGEIEFSLLCGYRAGGARSAEDLRRIRRVHTHSLG